MRSSGLLLALGALACSGPPGGGPAPAPAPAATAAPQHGARPSRARPPALELLVAATTDVHGHLRGWDYFANAPDSARGLSRAATVVDSLRGANPGRVVLVDAGDLLQGTPLTYVAARLMSEPVHPVIAAMNAMRYDAAAIGNHEFNYGLPVLDRALERAAFPFLAANAYAPDGKRAYPAYTLVERAGVKVGIVGATTPGAMVWDADNLRDHLVLRDIVPEVRSAVAEARAAGADLVVAVVHAGLDEPASYDTVVTGLPSENVAARLAREVPGIDLIVYGHSHRQMADTVIGRTLLVQPKNWATSVAVARLGLDRDRDGRWAVVAHEGRLLPVAGRAESDTVLAVTERAHRAAISYVTTPIGRTTAAWRADSARVADTPIMDFVLEVERGATGAQLASTAAFGLDAGLDSGAISVAQIARLYPYDNTLRVVRVTGRQLRAYLEHSARYYRTVDSTGAPLGGGPIIDPQVAGFNYDVVAGVDYTIDLTRPVGARVTRLLYAGAPVAETDTFTLALNNYRQSGGGGYAMLRDAPVVADRQLEIRQLLIDAVRRQGTLRPQDFFHANWTLVPAGAVTRAYTAMNAARTAATPAAAPAAASAVPGTRVASSP